MINEISSRAYMPGMGAMIGNPMENFPTITSMPYFPGYPGSEAPTMPLVAQTENRLLDLVFYLVGIMTRRTSDNSMPGFVNHCECQNASTEGASESKSGGFFGRIKDLFGNISETVETVKDGWNEGKGLFGVIRKGWEGLTSFTKPFVDGVGSFFKSPIQGIGNLFKGGFDLIKGLF
jgi:hypothetical protein